MLLTFKFPFKAPYYMFSNVIDLIKHDVSLELTRKTKHSVGS